jgi:hypothetical protein
MAMHQKQDRRVAELLYSCVQARLGEALWALLRTPAGNRQALTPKAEKLLCQLPAAVRPRLMVQRYGRVLNRIAQDLAGVRGDAARAEVVAAYLQDRRGSRHGFPMALWSELYAMYRHLAGGVDLPLPVRGDQRLNMGPLPLALSEEVEPPCIDDLEVESVMMVTATWEGVPEEA